MRNHTTTVTGWYAVQKLDMVGTLMKKTLTTQIDGCPYEINLEIALDRVELAAMGYENQSDDSVTYALNTHECEQEMDAHAMMWLHINAVKMAMSQHDTNSWRLEQWDKVCPFLFTNGNEAVFDEEEMQIERDTWT